MKPFTLQFFKYVLRFRTATTPCNYTLYVHVFKRTSKAYACLYVHSMRYVRDLTGKCEAVSYE